MCHTKRDLLVCCKCVFERMDPLKIQIISEEERQFIERQLREETSTSLIQDSENGFNFSSTIRNDKKESVIEHVVPY